MKKDKLIQIKIEQKLLDKFKASCAAEGMTMSQKIRLAIRKIVNKNNFTSKEY